MLNPKKSKFRKQHRGKMSGKASRGNKLAFGDYAIQALEATWLTSRQLEATRRTITRYIKRGGKLWIRIFPDKPITCKPVETRMGSGKGSPEYWVAVVQPGKILFELAGVSKDIAQSAMKLASYKLPIKTRFITHQDIIS